MTVREALADAGALATKRDGEVLLALVLEREHPWLRAHSEAQLTAEQSERFRSLIARRGAGEPLQYITGVQEFFGLPFRVSPGVLIPRPETEHLVEAVLRWANPHTGKLRLIDVGTGSGAIAVALATHLPRATIVATDISAEALLIAKENAAHNGVASRIEFRSCDLLCSSSDAADDEPFDAIVSNPPYISVHDAAAMQKEVVEHEPHKALFAGEGGLDVYRRLIPAARTALRAGGLLAMEIGYGQKSQLETMLAGWREIRFVNDYAAIPRVVLAERA